MECNNVKSESFKPVPTQLIEEEEENSKELQKEGFESLSNELIQRIFSFLDLESLKQCSLVSKNWSHNSKNYLLSGEYFSRQAENLLPEILKGITFFRNLAQSNNPIYMYQNYEKYQDDDEEGTIRAQEDCIKALEELGQNAEDFLKSQKKSSQNLTELKDNLRQLTGDMKKLFYNRIFHFFDFEQIEESINKGKITVPDFFITCINKYINFNSGINSKLNGENDQDNELDFHLNELYNYDVAMNWIEPNLKSAFSRIKKIFLKANQITITEKKDLILEKLCKIAVERVQTGNRFLQVSEVVEILKGMNPLIIAHSISDPEKRETIKNIIRRNITAELDSCDHFHKYNSALIINKDLPKAHRHASRIATPTKRELELKKLYSIQRTDRFPIGLNLALDDIKKRARDQDYESAKKIKDECLNLPGQLDFRKKEFEEKADKIIRDYAKDTYDFLAI